MADFENLNLGVMKDITLVVKRQDTGVRAGLGLAMQEIKIMKDITLTAAMADTSIRAGLGFALQEVKIMKDITLIGPMADTGLRAALGFLPKFLSVLTRIDGTSTVPFTRKVLGVFDNTMNPPNPGTYITGHITEDAVPVVKRLRLYDKATGHLIAETFSDALGEYRFNDVSTDNIYYIVAFDEDGSPIKNAKVIDNIQK